MDFSALDTVPAAELPGLLNAVLPEGIEVSEAYVAERKFSDIVWIGYLGFLHYEDREMCDVRQLEERLKTKPLMIQKKTKRGVSEIDLAPLISDVSFSAGDELTVRIKASAQNPSINPDNILSALAGADNSLIPDFNSFCRIEILDGDMRKFV